MAQAVQEAGLEEWLVIYLEEDIPERGVSVTVHVLRVNRK
jgi:hypothetical protein